MSHICSRPSHRARRDNYQLALYFHFSTSSDLLFSLSYCYWSQGHSIIDILHIEFLLKFCFLENPTQDIILLFFIKCLSLFIFCCWFIINWVIGWCRAGIKYYTGFRLYNIVIWHFITLRNTHHGNYKEHLSPYKLL